MTQLVVPVRDKSAALGHWGLFPVSPQEPQAALLPLKCPVAALLGLERSQPVPLSLCIPTLYKSP